ncbi:MAG: 23S rRNA (pseudouridine1915-N3)-methyltransferase [Methanosaeta sp. NSM2]|nr:23S rRNA (pseudouridine(1915)-N(3))-methyltransferase RlmH [Methanothrix sp.]OYV12030.1 MAG: 23S rRNA (pseudouridine1915-N3)-methyltransferase [Methanosaeta sp. NSM2]
MGRLRERHWLDGAADYARRIRPYARLEVEEVAESRLKEGASQAEEKKAMQDEGRAILEKLKGHDGVVVALDLQGRSLESLQMASWLGRMVLEGEKEVAFVIGGPLGLAPEVLERADCSLSFSRMTFPHQMMRVILLEQIYRWMRIMRKEPYHR